MHISLNLFYAERPSKILMVLVGTSYKGNLISLFTSIHYLFMIIGVQKHKLRNN